MVDYKNNNILRGKNAMRMIIQFMKDYKKESVLAPLFKMLEAILELFVPLVVAAIIDQGIYHEDRPYIWLMSLLLFALALIGLLFSVTAQYFAAKSAVGAATAMRSKLFAHILSFGYTEMDAIGSSTLITRMTSDINQVQNGVNMFLRLFMRSPFIVVGAMVAAFIIDVRSAIIFAVAIPLLAVIVFIIMYVSIPLYKKVQSRLDTVLGITRENLTGVRVIRAFHKEEGEVERFEEANESLSSLQIFVGKISALMNPATYAVVNLSIVAIIWVGGIRVNTGAISQGEVVALINYMSQILVELIKLANLIVLINKAIACGNRVQSVFEISSSMVESPSQSGDTDTDMSVEFKDVSLRYGSSETDSLSEITFSAKKGETIGIIGGTGSGKSSIVNMIPRFYDAFSGEVLVDGKNVKDYSIKALRGKIGVVPQKAVLFNGTIRENLLWGNENASDEDIYEALKISQATDVVEGRRKGLDSEVAQGGKNFSGGQRQRLTIARALVRKPEILILDDSASALDFATDAALRKAIREMENSPTVFIVSQRASSIQYADKIIVLDDGRIAGIGSHDSLLESCGVYQEIYYSQFPKNRKED